MSKPKSYAALARENERLHAQVGELKAQIANHFRVYGDQSLRLIDCEIREAQAVRILMGTDE